MTDYSGLSDEELVQEVHAGDDGAMDYLMNKYKKLVRRISSARFLVGGDQEDLVQEGMIGLYHAVRDYKPGKNASFRTFAALCIDRQISHAVESSLRVKHRMLNDYLSLSDEEWEEAFLNTGKNPETLLVDQEMTDEMLGELRTALSPLETCVLELSIAGMDYREIAKKMGRTPKSIDNALQRIRKKAKSIVYKSTNS